jgi:hypothetical protein
MITTTEPWPCGNDDENRALRRGNHLRAGRPGTVHHDGIYLGNGHVIHLTGLPGGGKAAARVRIDTLEVFAVGRPVTVRPYASNHDPDAIIARAMSKLGDGNYHLIFNNCQHYARWCATGDHLSEQVNSAVATAGAVAAPAAAASAGISVVGSAGIVAGLSGPGIMSGLATCGAIIGGGAVAGMIVLSVAPALISVASMNHALRQDDDLPDAERNARTAGRIGTTAGALLGSAGSIATISALGVPGLSAAGISSGLAAIGAAAIGGGMAAGTMCVIAAPAITAAILGYLIYRAALWVNSSTQPGTTGRTATT